MRHIQASLYARGAGTRRYKPVKRSANYPSGISYVLFVMVRLGKHLLLTTIPTPRRSASSVSLNCSVDRTRRCIIRLRLRSV